MRIKVSNFFFLILGLIGFKATPAIAADSIFLCSDSLEGETADQRYPGCIDVLAWSWGASIPIDQSSGGGGAGKVTFQDLNITKSVDKSSITLASHLPMGEVIPKLEILVDNCVSECNNSAYYKLTLEDVLVSSITLGGTAGDDRPTEQVAFNFAKIQWCYSTIDAEGQLGSQDCGGWDIERNVALP